VVGTSTTSYGVRGVSGTSDGVSGFSSGSDGVVGSSSTRYGVRGDSPYEAVYGRSAGGVGVHGSTDSSNAVWGTANTNGVGVRGDSGSGIGVLANSDSGTGVRADAPGGIGVYATSSSSTGVVGESSSSYGVAGISDSGTGVYGRSSSSFAGYFDGPVRVVGALTVTGTLTKGGGSFQIDHPLDPANKLLSHSFVESPDMKNIYDGVAALDDNGEATVGLPAWLETLNSDFRYQLTCLGGYAPVFIAQEVQGNQFKIAGGRPGLKVSWQVTGIRQDAYAKAHRIQVEEEKPDKERGYYLHPKEFGLPEEKGVEWVRDGGRRTQAARREAASQLEP